ncbi:hypothetical protein [Rhizobium sp. SAFR-030]|uniref:hypothetical protein n=1 Tax=Rhizobium sp. SAFR-030 TaxID=3387277 RepID=UPI003F7FD1E1
MPIASSLMFSFVAIITAIGAHLADYSSTHLFTLRGQATPNIMQAIRWHFQRFSEC